jgi:tellurite resistance-related uncharacterized protein
VVRSVEWDEATLPAGLRRAHRLGTGTWGRITIRAGSLVFHAQTDPPIEVELEEGSTRVIPPGVEHDVDPVGPVRLTLDFMTVQRQAATDHEDAGGDPACWAGLLCPECGGVVGDGSGHRPGCLVRWNATATRGQL